MQTKRESRCREQVGTPASRPVPPAKTDSDLYGVVGHANMSDSPVVGGFDRALTHTISGAPLRQELCFLQRTIKLRKSVIKVDDKDKVGDFHGSWRDGRLHQSNLGKGRVGPTLNSLSVFRRLE
jgi:hypothetical protein